MDNQPELIEDTLSRVEDSADESIQSAAVNKRTPWTWLDLEPTVGQAPNYTGEQHDGFRYDYDENR